MKRPWLKRYDPHVPKIISLPNLTLPQVLENSAKAFPNNPAMVFENIPITFSELSSLVDRFATQLNNLGVGKNIRVGLVLPNCPQFVIAFFSVLKAGGVVVAMNPQFSKMELFNQIRDTQVLFIIGFKEKRDIFTDLASELNIKGLIFTNEKDAAILTSSSRLKMNLAQVYSTDSIEYEFQELITKSCDFEINDQSSPDNPAIFQFSGGTTGLPKAAIGLHRNLVANAYQFMTWLGAKQDGSEAILAVIPLFHVYGMVLAMVLGILLGARIILIPNGRDIKDLLSQIAIHHPTIFPGVPNLFSSIIRHPDFSDVKSDLGSIKVCISGSAPLPKLVKEKFERVTGAKLIEGYGLSEAPTATHCNPIRGDNRTGSIGLPLPNVDCRIVTIDDDTIDVPLGDAGELLIRGPQVFIGYYQMPEESQMILRNGWLHTGDIARMDEDGYFYLVDRKKELIKVGGFQVWPREVEDILLQHPSVREAAVAGQSDGKGGEVITAWIVLHDGAKINRDELNKYCQKFLARYKIPKKFQFRSELPRSSVGKILRRVLKEEALVNKKEVGE